jgi:hypothetical protein
VLPSTIAVVSSLPQVTGRATASVTPDTIQVAVALPLVTIFGSLPVWIVFESSPGLSGVAEKFPSISGTGDQVPGSQALSEGSEGISGMEGE